MRDREVYIPWAPGDTSQTNDNVTGECDDTNQLHLQEERVSDRQTSHCGSVSLIQRCTNFYIFLSCTKKKKIP